MAVAVVVILLFSSIVLVTTREARAAGSSVLVVAQQSDPGVLNNMLGDTLGSFFVNQNVYQELVQLNYNGTGVIPQLAYAWNVSSDNLNYTFHLHTGVEWSDGQPFTAADVVYTMDTAMSLPAWYIGYLFGVTHVYEDDPYNVSFVLSTPNAGWLTQFAFGCGFGLNILPAHLYQGTNVTTNPHNQDPIGTGPYLFAGHVAGQSITLKANPNYWGGEPSIQTVIIDIIPSVGTTLEDLQQGTVQYVNTFDNPVDFSQVPPLVGTDNIVISHPTGGVITTVLFNTNATPFNNQLVREAFAYGINRTELADKAYFDYASAMYGFYLTGPWFNSSAQIPYDPAKAEALLTEAGYAPASNGTRMTIGLDYAPLFGMDVESEILQQQLAAIGVQVILWNADYATWFNQVQVVGDYQMAVRACQIGPDPTLYWQWLNPVHEGESGSTYFNNTTMVNLFNAAAAITNFTQRQADYNTIQGILAAQVPIIPLTNIQDVNLWRSDMVTDLGPQIGTTRWDLSQAKLVGGGSTSSTTPASTLEIVAIAAVIIIVVAVLGVVWNTRRKKQRDAKEDEEDPTATASGSGEPPAGPKPPS
ncbi:MAG: ABC transporter substrate-binding protein [Thermoplasmata archaeon]